MEVLSLLCNMRHANVKPDAVILASAIEALERAGAFSHALRILAVTSGSAAAQLTNSPSGYARAQADCSGIIALLNWHDMLSSSTLERLRHHACLPALRQLGLLAHCLPIIFTSGLPDRRTSSTEGVRSPYLQGVCDLGSPCTRDASERLGMDDDRSLEGIQGRFATSWLLRARMALAWHLLCSSDVKCKASDRAPALPQEPVATRMAAWASSELVGGL